VPTSKRPDAALPASRTAESAQAVRPVPRIGQLEIVTVVLAACLPLRPAIGGLPLSTIAAMGLVVVAAFRRPAVGRRVPVLVGLGSLALVGWLVVGSAAGGGLDVRRAGSLVILLALGWVLAQGRLHRQSVFVGLGAGWFGGIAHAVLTRDESTYDGRITGYLGDPNGAGFIIITLGCVLIAGARDSGRRLWPIWLVTVAATALTVSRTSVFALGAVTVWALIAPRLNRLVSVLVLAVGWPVYGWLVDLAQATGFFAERAGSDDLRARLAVVETHMVDQAGLRGFGIGSARAVVDGAPLWFHNSYWALRVEGGLVAFALLFVCLIGLAWSAHRVPRERRNAWYESAVLAGLICSVNIGFSLTSVTMAVAVGLYLDYWRRTVDPPAPTETGDEPAAHARGWPVPR
jgi:hypothetical protein